MLLLWQPTTYLFYLSAVSVQEILYPRSILGHKIGGFRASEGLSKKHEFKRRTLHVPNLIAIWVDLNN